MPTFATHRVCDPAVFGKVLDGMDVVKAVEAVGSQSGTTSKTVTIDDSGELEMPAEPVEASTEL